MSRGGSPRRLTELSVDGSPRIAQVKLMFHVLQSYLSLVQIFFSISFCLLQV